MSSAVTKKSLRERLTDDFHHVVVGHDPSVLEKLTDPAFNLAVWENAASEKIIAYFDNIASADSHFGYRGSHDMLRDAFRAYHRSGKDSDKKYEQGILRGRLNNFLPAGDGKDEAIAFLMQLADLFYTFVKQPYRYASLRFTDYADPTLNAFHRDGGTFRMLVSLSHKTDTHTGDGSTLIIPNSVSQKLRQSREGDVNFYEGRSHCTYVGVGNVALFSCREQQDRFPLYHAMPDFIPNESHRRKRRVLYVLST